jgi:hypothetical protein
MMAEIQVGVMAASYTGRVLVRWWQAIWLAGHTETTGRGGVGPPMWVWLVTRQSKGEGGNDDGNSDRGR